MNITPEHWLDTANRQELSGGSAMNVRRFLVIHFTSGASAQSSVDFWRTPQAKGACAHLVIDRDGSVIQCRPFNRTCGHAGQSVWTDPRTGIEYNGLNACSIGIELANAGDDAALARRWTKLPLPKLRHKHGGPLVEWEAYPPAQIQACTTIAQAIVAHYKLDDIVGHDDIAPARKNDPGPAFPMQALREACGFKGLPARLAKR